MAQGLHVCVSPRTWQYVRHLVEEVITVDDREIIAAMRFVWERMKVIIEPSAAVAVAALMSPAFDRWRHLRRVAVVLSGGNVDLEALPWCTGK